MEMAKARCLYNYLVMKTPNVVKGNEKWSRYFFRQFISGLKQMHTNSIAHLDIKIDNILLDIIESEACTGKLELEIKIADFGMSKNGPLDQVDGKCGACYTPPEVLMK
jgi:serine/threonine protein kinase